jgi:superfamily I DNA/RNA helicase
LGTKDPLNRARHGLPAYLRDLNVAQRAAVEHGASDVRTAEIPGPLLIIAGAGTGKTSTLAHRVAHLILAGTLPERILLLTFTRRAAAEMTNRAQRILSAARATRKPGALGPAGEISWSGTNAIGNRLLREHADRLCHGDERWLGRGEGPVRSHAAARASCHCAAASALKIRSVDREMCVPSCQLP